MSGVFEIVKPSFLKGGIKSLKAQQLSRLYSTGFTSLDEVYKVYLGSCTDITGYPYSGKTLFLKELLISTSKNKGLKHLIYLPDSGSNFEVGADLIHAVSGKTTQEGLPNSITPTEFKYWFEWLNEYFTFIKPKDTTRLSPIDFWRQACEMDVNTISIDSWNYMKVDRDTKTLGDTLSLRNQLAEESGKHFFTIIHPRNPQSTDYDKQTGDLKPPTAFNLMGGSEWNNNGKSIIVVHKFSKEDPNYWIRVEKTKPRIVGKTGHVALAYDFGRGQFFKQGHVDRYYGYTQVMEEQQQRMNIKQDKLDPFSSFEDDLPF